MKWADARDHKKVNRGKRKTSSSARRIAYSTGDSQSANRAGRDRRGFGPEEGGGAAGAGVGASGGVEGCGGGRALREAVREEAGVREERDRREDDENEGFGGGMLVELLNDVEREDES